MPDLLSVLELKKLALPSASPSKYIDAYPEAGQETGGDDQLTLPLLGFVSQCWNRKNKNKNKQKRKPVMHVKTSAKTNTESDRDFLAF